MESNKVSLIITVFNRIHLLRKGLQSLFNQSVKPDELILSDDGSNENIVSGISDIVANLSFPVKFVTQKNNGFRLARCRNNAVKHSMGDLLIFLDQDIIHTENFLETFISNQKEKRFITSYPVRLTELQSEKLTEKIIFEEDLSKYVMNSQKNKIRKQFIKDYVSYIGLKIGTVKQKPKLRGGVCAINRKDYLSVNGYDEKFKGWGNEDDDIRRRLYKSGVIGYNPFFNEFPLHLYHEPFHQNGERVNEQYVSTRIPEIKSGDYKCKYGIDNSYDKDSIELINLK